jgi:photosystem II stability/assembly factor-like uncharacterized protein
VNALAASGTAGSGTNILAGTGLGVFRTTDGGDRWTSVNNGLTNPYIRVLAVSGTSLIAGTSGGVFHSTDNGTNWAPVSSGLTDTSIGALAVSGRVTFAGTENGGIYRSTDYGKNWSVANNRVVNTAWVAALAVSSSGTKLFAGTDAGVFLSTDSGATWTATGATGNPIWALAVSGTSLFAGIGEGVFQSTNDGADWSAVDNGLNYRGLLHSFAVSGTSLFAGTWGGGVFFSRDNGTNWTAVNDGIVPDNVMINALVAPGANVFAGTRSDPFSNFSVTNGGVYKRPLSEIVAGVGVSTNQVPALFRLEQNYPNPFNPSTTIRYALPSTSHVTLTVFNTLGQRVATLVDENQDAGYHDVKFDGNSLASGLYFYRLTAGDYLATKRLLLLK